MDCGNPLNRLAEAVLTSTHNSCFEQKYENYQNFFIKKCFFVCVCGGGEGGGGAGLGRGGKILNIFEYACFRNGIATHWGTGFRSIQLRVSAWQNLQ